MTKKELLQRMESNTSIQNEEMLYFIDYINSHNELEGYEEWNEVCETYKDFRIFVWLIKTVLN